LSTVVESSDTTELLLDVLYNIGRVLVEDDIRDFPWDHNEIIEKIPKEYVRHISHFAL
jgi:hypothetical protein